MTRKEIFNNMTEDEKLTLYYLESIHFYLLWKSIHASQQTIFIYNFLKKLMKDHDFDYLISKLDNRTKSVLKNFVVNFFNRAAIDQSCITQAAFGQLAKQSLLIKNDCLLIIDILQRYVLTNKPIITYDKNTEYFLNMASKHGNSSPDKLINYFKSDLNKITYMIFPERIGNFYAVYDISHGINNIIFMHNTRDTHIDFLIDNMKLLPKDIKYTNTISKLVYGSNISQCFCPGFCVKKSGSICVLITHSDGSEKHQDILPNMVYDFFNIKPEIMNSLITNYNECHRVHTLLHELFGHGTCLDHPNDEHDYSVLHYEESYADMTVLYMAQFPELMTKISTLDYSELKMGIWYITIINHLFNLQNMLIGNNMKNYSLATMILLNKMSNGIHLSHNSMNKKINLDLNIDVLSTIGYEIIKTEMINIHKSMRNKDIRNLNYIFDKYMRPMDTLINILSKLGVNDNIVPIHKNILPIIRTDDDIIISDKNVLVNYIVQFTEIEKMIKIK